MCLVLKSYRYSALISGINKPGHSVPKRRDSDLKSLAPRNFHKIYVFFLFKIVLCSHPGNIILATDIPPTSRKGDVIFVHGSITRASFGLPRYIY